MTNHIDHDSPLKALTDVAARTRDALDLKHRPVVVRSEANAFSIADRSRGQTVMLGEGAYWVVCLADAARLERAGFEFAPRR